MSHPHRQPSRRGHLLNIIMTAFFGVALSVLLAVVVWQLERAELSDRFGRDATHITTSVANAFLETLTILDALGALYMSSEAVTRNEFHSFTQTLLDNRSGVKALGWVPRVSSLERQTFEMTSGVSITETGPDGDLTTASARTEYFPLAFVAPMAGNEAILGFDVASAPEQQEALSRARDTGEAAATPRLTLGQDSRNAYGVRVYLPLYQQGVPSGTPEQRQVHLLSFVSLDLLFDAVVEAVLSSHDIPGMRLLICDEEAALQNRFLYTVGLGEREGAALCHEEPATKLHLRETFTLAGRQWSVLVSPAPGHYTFTSSWRPWSLLVLGFMLSALLVRHLQLLYRRAQELAASHHALSEENRQRKEAEAKLQEANRALVQLADEDALTGLANRRRFNTFFKREWRRAQRTGSPLSLILLDIDHFKDYNDHYGHAAGDQALMQVAQQLRALAGRPSDLAARYGGEEFAVILPDTPAEGALALAETMRGAVEGLELPHEGAPLNNGVTISLGVGTYLGEHEKTTSSFFQDVDKALYEAKRRGRNQVVEVDAVQDPIRD